MRGPYRGVDQNRARHADRDGGNTEYARARPDGMRGHRRLLGYPRVTTLRFVNGASFTAPKDGAATSYRAMRNVGKAVFDALRGARPADGATDEEPEARVGRRLYWVGAARQPRREGTVVAVYRESRDQSARSVLVIDVRWDPPSASDRPRGPLSLGIPVARVGTAGWGWVDDPDPVRSVDALPNATPSFEDHLGVALRKRFGIAVRQIRKSQGLSQECLAMACGLHRTFIGAVERGQTNVSLATLGRLAEGLRVSVSHLAAEAESLALDVRQGHR